MCLPTSQRGLFEEISGLKPEAIEQFVTTYWAVFVHALHSNQGGWSPT
jgi:hypothetical protein